jgi:hypothetical protein
LRAGEYAGEVVSIRGMWFVADPRLRFMSLTYGRDVIRKDKDKARAIHRKKTAEEERRVLRQQLR